MRRRNDSRHARRNSGGFYTVVFAIMLPLLIGTLGLGLDISHWWWAQGQLQNAADSAAFAGAKDLNSTPTGRTRAVASAQSVTTQYKVDGVVLTNTDISENAVGTWTFDTSSFSTTSVADYSANAIRVTLVRQDVPSYFAGFFPNAKKKNTLTASATAVAGGARSVGCAAPVALGACVLQYDANGKMICPTQLSFQGGMTSVGLTLPDGSSPVNGNKAEPYFAAVFGNPDGCSYAATVGSTLHLQNGNDLSKDSVKVINEATDDGANPVSVVFPVVDVGTCGSSGPTYNKSAVVVGFLKMKVVGARFTGAAPKKVGDACPSLGKKDICVTSDCSAIDGAPPGGTIAPIAERVYLVK
jgi:Flp pilus assembly protein TadG